MTDRLDNIASRGPGGCPHPATPSPRHPVIRSRGFSFAEVLFAVIILGIGFILVAAIFPVAIQQTQSTVDDAAAAQAARGAAGVIAAVPTLVPNPKYLVNPTNAQLTANPAVAVRQLTVFPPTVKNYVPSGAADIPPPAVVVPFTGFRGDLVAGNLVNATDPRFAYVPFYRRENGSPVAQLIVIAISARNRPVYDPAVDATIPGTVYAGPTVTPALHGAVAGMVTPDYVSLTGGSPAAWVGEGCPVPTLAGSLRSYRLGRALMLTSPATRYEMDPADALAAAPGPDGLWGTADDIYDGVANTNPIRPTATAQPVAAYAGIFAAAGSAAGRITLSADLVHATGTVAPNVPPAAAVQGAFIVIADDYPYDSGSPAGLNYSLPTVAANRAMLGKLNGHVYRLGPPVPADTLSNPKVLPGTFELDPQYETVPAGTPPGAFVVPLPFAGGGNNTLARVYLVGAGRTNALSASDANPDLTLTTYSGPAQDIGVYTTLFPVQ